MIGALVMVVCIFMMGRMMMGHGGSGHGSHGDIEDRGNRGLATSWPSASPGAKSQEEFEQRKKVLEGSSDRCTALICCGGGDGHAPSAPAAAVRRGPTVRRPHPLMVVVPVPHIVGLVPRRRCYRNRDHPGGRRELRRRSGRPRLRLSGVLRLDIAPLVASIVVGTVGWLKGHRPAAVVPALASAATIFLVTVLRSYEEFGG